MEYVKREGSIGCPSVFCKPDKIRGKMGRKPFYVEKEAAYGTDRKSVV